MADGHRYARDGKWEDERKGGEEGQGEIRLMVNPTTLVVSHA
jgi:hypothetical protein